MTEKDTATEVKKLANNVIDQAVRIECKVFCSIGVKLCAASRTG